MKDRRVRGQCSPSLCDSGKVNDSMARKVILVTLKMVRKGWGLVGIVLYGLVGDWFSLKKTYEGYCTCKQQGQFSACQILTSRLGLAWMAQTSLDQIMDGGHFCSFHIV